MPGRGVALPPAQALTGKAQFDRLFRARQSVASRFFRAHYLDNGEGGPRLGMAIGRKIDKRAVVRNRLRRRVRESCRRQIPNTLAMDVVVTARSEVAQATASEIWQDLQALWSRLLRRFEQASPDAKPSSSR